MLGDSFGHVEFELYREGGIGFGMNILTIKENKTQSNNKRYPKDQFVR
jgi:hypothetical protein